MTDHAPLTRRAHNAAARAANDPHATPADIADAVCHELAAWCREEAVMYAARRPALNPGDQAHVSVIDQVADYLARVGDMREPS